MRKRQGATPTQHAPEPFGSKILDGIDYPHLSPVVRFLQKHLFTSHKNPCALSWATQSCIQTLYTDFSASRQNGLLAFPIIGSGDQPEV